MYYSSPKTRDVVLCHNCMPFYIFPQARSSTDFSGFGSSRVAPSSTAASSFMMPSISGTNTTASSVASAPTSAAAAAAGGLELTGMSSGHSSDSKLQQQQQGAAGSGHSSSFTDLTTASAAAAVAAASSRDGLIIGPQKPSHRSKHNGVIQVLSVDDDPVNQLVASTSLKSNKWEVVKSMSGSAALSWLEGADCMPDLVLLDVMMPSMSGFEVASRVREVYPSSLLPIIMVSRQPVCDCMFLNVALQLLSLEHCAGDLVSLLGYRAACCVGDSTAANTICVRCCTKAPQHAGSYSIYALYCGAVIKQGLQRQWPRCTDIGIEIVMLASLLNAAGVRKD